MFIKTLNQERQPIDVKEWNDETKVYIRPLNGFEQLVFNDLFLTFYSKDVDYKERFNAGFKAAQMALVLEDNTPLFNEEDAAIIENASIIPLYRLFDAILKTTRGDFDTTKKN